MQAAGSPEAFVVPSACAGAMAAVPLFPLPAVGQRALLRWVSIGGGGFALSIEVQEAVEEAAAKKKAEDQAAAVEEVAKSRPPSKRRRRTAS